MTIHLTIWLLLWGPLAAIYVLGVFYGMVMSAFVDDVDWWLRPIILVWPVALAALYAWHLVLFLIGKE